MPGYKSWEIHSGLDQSLALALYVREAAGLGPFVVALPEVGALHPAVTPSDRDEPPPGLKGLSAAVHEWPIWWQRVLRTSAHQWLLPGIPGWDRLADLTTTTQLAEQHQDAFWSWLQTIRTSDPSADQEGDNDDVPGDGGGDRLTEYVNDFADRLGRPVRPFQLRLRALPLHAAEGWLVDDQQVVLSLRLLHDQVALERFLEPVVLRIA